MSDTRENGGPAFPSVTPRPDQREVGMSLRDYFAGQVVSSACGGIWPTDTDIPEIVHKAYAIADAMLTERAKPAALGERNGGAG